MKLLKVKHRLFMKIPDILLSEILTYLKNGWIYDRKKSIEMLKIGKQLKHIRIEIGYFLLNTPLHIYNGMNVHHLINRQHIERIIEELFTYMNGYTIHHKLIPKCLNMTIYYMKRLGKLTNSRDILLMKKQSELEKLLVLYGYCRRLSDKLINL